MPQEYMRVLAIPYNLNNEKKKRRQPCGNIGGQQAVLYMVHSKPLTCKDGRMVYVMIACVEFLLSVMFVGILQRGHSTSTSCWFQWWICELGKRIVLINNILQRISEWVQLFTWLLKLKQLWIACTWLNFPLCVDSNNLQQQWSIWCCLLMRNVTIESPNLRLCSIRLGPMRTLECTTMMYYTHLIYFSVICRYHTLKLKPTMKMRWRKSHAGQFL